VNYSKQRKGSFLPQIKYYTQDIEKRS